MAFIHLAFVAFVTVGVFVVRGSLPLTIFHILCVTWAVGTMAFDWGCPLTPWEKDLWRRGGREPYETGFLRRYVLRRAPRDAAENRRTHVRLGAWIAALNVVLYLIFLR